MVECWVCPRGRPEDMSDLRNFTAHLAEENTSQPTSLREHLRPISPLHSCSLPCLIFTRGYDLPGQRWKGTAGRGSWFLPYFGPGSRHGEKKKKRERGYQRVSRSRGGLTGLIWGDNNGVHARPLGRGVETQGPGGATTQEVYNTAKRVFNQTCNVELAALGRQPRWRWR